MARVCMMVAVMVSGLSPASGIFVPSWPESEMTKSVGHYPYYYCGLTHVVLNGSDGMFHYNSDTDLLNTCDIIPKMWDIQSSADMKETECDGFFNIGYTFTVFYWYGQSNYYHLHTDLLLPLYSIYHQKNEDDFVKQKAAFMPMVETSRLKKLDWNTPAFTNDTKYWMQIVKFIAGKSVVIPLGNKLRSEKKVYCFQEVHFGTPSVDLDEKYIKGFVSFVQRKLDVTVSESGPAVPKVGLISRSNRRRILNEKELVEAMKPIVDFELVVFEGMTFKEQVEAMQRYTVVAGVNGAGLMNCLYLPPDGVCIQLVPYNATLNFVQFGQLLSYRGPYLEWHNKHKDLTREVPGDPNINRPDTIVHVEEFKELVQKALNLHEQSKLRLNEQSDFGRKQEL